MLAAKLLHATLQDDGRCLFVHCRGNAHVMIVGSSVHLSYDRRHQWTRSFTIHMSQAERGLIALVVELPQDSETLTFEYFLKVNLRDGKPYLFLDEHAEPYGPDGEVTGFISSTGTITVWDHPHTLTSDPEQVSGDMSFYVADPNDLCRYLNGDYDLARINGIALRDTKRIEKIAKLEEQIESLQDRLLTLHVAYDEAMGEKENLFFAMVNATQEAANLEHDLGEFKAKRDEQTDRLLHLVADVEHLRTEAARAVQLAARVTELEHQREQLLDANLKQLAEIRHLKGEPNPPVA